jgi:hypothetical protein
VFGPFLIITSPCMLSGDVLIFYVSFSLLVLLLLLLLLLRHPDLSGDVLLFYVSFSLLLLLRHPGCCRVMYCYSTFLFHYYYYYYYYYVTPAAVG